MVMQYWYIFPHLQNWLSIQKRSCEFTYALSLRVKSFEISGCEVLKSCSIDLFQVSRTLFFLVGDSIFNLLPQSWNGVCSAANMIVVKDTNNIKRKSKCLSELDSKYIQQCYYYEDTSFFGKKNATQHSISRSSFPSQFCVRLNFTIYKSVVFTVSWYKQCWLHALPSSVWSSAC